MGVDKRLLSALAVAVAATAAYLALFPDRSDYGGHFVAGAGGTLLLLAPVLLVPRGGGWRAVGVLAVAVLLGVGTEATVFKLAEFDQVDLANQSLGATVAAAGALDARGWLDAGVAALGGLLLVAAGFHHAFA